VTAADCPSCADERAAGAAFCEACGRGLTERRCAACDGVVGDDGYCGQCGKLAGRARDHVEIDCSPAAAAVTDRGQRHHRNEDAVFLVARDADVDVVVCDGVSSSFDPDVASATAAERAGELLSRGEVVAAIAEAGAAVAALAGTGDPRRAASNPACTIVAAQVRGAAVDYGWVGDSRAYWVPADGPAEQLTEDDSWATHAIALGADPAEAMRSPQAHAITAWLGADAGALSPRGSSFRATAPGHLVLCSDGLWNYLTDAADFARTVREHLAAGDLLAAARSLTAFANDAGGADNITVAVIPVRPGPEE
jgi:serine/threonine protein phosphatase PrpC